MSDFNDISNSSGPGSSAEPSMEEILASIRRILKEDGGDLPAKVDIDDDVLLLDDSMLAEPADFSSATELPPEPAMITPHADAAGATFQQAGHFSSEPTFAVDDYANDGAPDRQAEPAGAGGAEPGAAAPEPAAAQPEFDQPEAYQPEAYEPEAYQPEAYQPEPHQPEAYQPEPYQPEAYQPAPHVPVDEPAPAAPLAEVEHLDDTAIYRPNPEEAMSENVQPPHGLLSEEASNAAASSIGALVRSISAERSVAVSRGGVTIEDIVREEIRPVLKAWMDTHLPSLVERLVRQEIERVVERGAS